MKISSTAYRLKEYMETNHLRQIDVIEKCKPYCDRYNTTISRPMMSQWLSGRCVPSQAKLRVLSEALGVSESWLLGYDVPAESSGAEIKYDSLALLMADVASDPSCIDLLNTYVMLDSADKSSLIKISKALDLLSKTKK